MIKSSKPDNNNNKIRFDCSHLSPQRRGCLHGSTAALGGERESRTGWTGGKDRRAEEKKRRREEKTMKDRTDGTIEKQGNETSGYLWGSVFPLSW